MSDDEDMPDFFAEGKDDEIEINEEEDLEAELEAELEDDSERDLGPLCVLDACTDRELLPLSFTATSVLQTLALNHGDTNSPLLTLL
jgi:hypothetical protein